MIMKSGFRDHVTRGFYQAIIYKTAAVDSENKHKETVDTNELAPVNEIVSLHLFHFSVIYSGKHSKETYANRHFTKKVVYIQLSRADRI